MKTNRFESAIGIPRLIHQTYSSTNLPDELSENVKNIKLMNPNWSHYLYSDHDINKFILEHYDRKMLERYQRIDNLYGAARADFFRYLVIYEFGGVYLDIKSSATKPFDQIIMPQDRFLLSQWDNAQWGVHPELSEIEGGEFQQWHIIAAPNHPFLREVIKDVCRNIDQYTPWKSGVGKTGVLRMTGPIAYSLAVKRAMDMTNEYRLVNNEKEISLVYNSTKSKRHHIFFKSHYTFLNHSILKLNLIDKILFFGFRVHKKLKNEIINKKNNPRKRTSGN